jgi:hypothetical protein
LDISGHLLLATSQGPLDVLGTIGDNLGYQELLKDTTEMDVAEGLRVRVLNLDKYIEIKEKLAREKDRSVLAVLRRTLEEKMSRRFPPNKKEERRPRKTLSTLQGHQSGRQGSEGRPKTTLASKLSPGPRFSTSSP